LFINARFDLKSGGSPHLYLSRALVLAVLALTCLTSVSATQPLYVSVYVDRANEFGRTAVTVFGEVTKSDLSPVALVEVSIEVNDPYGSSVHVAFMNTGKDGSYSDTFQLEKDAPAGNYTIYITANKLGFADAQAKLTFSIGVIPFDISISPSSITVKRGDNATFRVSLESDQVSLPISVEVIDLPEFASYSLSSNNQTAPSIIILTIEISEKVNPGSYGFSVVGRSVDMENQASAQVLVQEADGSRYYLLVSLIPAAILVMAVILRKRRKKETDSVEPSPTGPEYLEGLALSPSTLLSLPDHLRKTAVIVCNLKEASANEVAARSGRARAAESDYLNQLVRMGHLKKKRKGRESYFYAQ
jgi:hypothetical protein